MKTQYYKYETRVQHLIYVSVNEQIITQRKYATSVILHNKEMRDEYPLKIKIEEIYSIPEYWEVSTEEEFQKVLQSQIDIISDVNKIYTPDEPMEEPKHSRLFEAITTTLNEKSIPFRNLRVVETQLLNEKGEIENNYAIYCWIAVEELPIGVWSREHKHKSDAYKAFIKSVETFTQMKVVTHTSIKPKAEK